MINWIKKWAFNKGTLLAIAMVVTFFAHGFFFAYGFFNYIDCCVVLK